MFKLMQSIARVGLVLLLLACDKDKDDNRPALAQSDSQFVEKAALANLAEIQLGQLAALKSDNAAVKAFGQQMVDEHSEAQKELEILANNYRGINWPGDVDAEHLGAREQLTALSGAVFDTLYLYWQVTDHQKALAFYQTQIDSGKVAAIRAYALKYRPHIQSHLNESDSIAIALKGQPTPTVGRTSSFH